LRTQIEIEKEISAVEADRILIFAKIKPLQDRNAVLYDELKKLREELASIFEDEGKLESIEFLIKSYNSNKSSMKQHNALSKWASEHGMIANGYHAETGQPCLNIMLYRDGSNYDKTLAAIREVVPFYKPTKNGRIYFGIFEHALSKNYSYRFEATPDLETCFVFNHYQRDGNSWLFKGSLEDALKDVQKNYWYQKTERE